MRAADAFRAVRPLFPGMVPVGIQRRFHRGKGSKNPVRGKGRREKIFGDSAGFGRGTAASVLARAGGSSVFDLDRNYVETETGGGTRGIVYYRTPCLIYRFVRDTVGEERFLEAFNEFIRRAEMKKTVRWEDFGAVMKEYGVSGERWERFEAEL